MKVPIRVFTEVNIPLFMPKRVVILSSWIVDEILIIIILSAGKYLANFYFFCLFAAQHKRN